MQAAVAAAASNVVDSFITEDEVVEGVAHGLVLNVSKNQISLARETALLSVH